MRREGLGRSHLNASKMHRYMSGRKGRDSCSPLHCITGRHSSTLFLCALVNGKRLICLTMYTCLKMGYNSLCLSLAKGLRKISFDCVANSVTAEVE